MGRKWETASQEGLVGQVVRDQAGAVAKRAGESGIPSCPLWWKAAEPAQPGKAGGGGAIKNLLRVLRIWDFTVSVTWSS